MLAIVDCGRVGSQQAGVAGKTPRGRIEIALSDQFGQGEASNARGRRGNERLRFHLDLLSNFPLN